MAVACAILGFAAGNPSGDEVPSIDPLKYSDEDQKICKELAKEFAQWWLSGALDFNSRTCHRNHIDAYKWMLTDPKELQNEYPIDTLTDAITNGRAQAVPQLYTIQQFDTESPDHQLIKVKGNIRLTIDRSVDAYPFEMDIFVTRVAGNMRIFSIQDRSTPSFASRVRSTLR